jgi:hypothetical protein
MRRLNSLFHDCCSNFNYAIIITPDNNIDLITYYIRVYLYLALTGQLQASFISAYHNAIKMYNGVYKTVEIT